MFSSAALRKDVDLRVCYTLRVYGMIDGSQLMAYEHYVKLSLWRASKHKAYCLWYAFFVLIGCPYLVTNYV